LARNKNGQQNVSIPGKDLLLLWRARLARTSFKKTERGNRIEIRGFLQNTVSEEDAVRS